MIACRGRFSVVQGAMRVNRRIVILGLPIVLVAAILAGLSSLPQAHAGGYPGGPGTVCLIGSSAVTSLAAPGPCANGPYTFDGPFPSSPQTGATQLRVGVYINGSNSLNGFDVILISNATVLRPAGYDLTGTVLLGTPIVIVVCNQGTLIVGSACSPSAGPGTLEVAATSGLGAPLTVAPTTGLLFTAIYNITGTSVAGGTALGFQTGCSNTSVPGGVCVTVSKAPNPVPAPETVQTGSMFNNAACATTCTIPWIALTSNVTSVSVSKGASSGSGVELVAHAENGWPGFSTDSVIFTATASNGGPAVVFNTVSCSTGGTSCNVNVTLSTLTAGNFFVTFYGTYVAFDTTGPTQTLVATETIQVHIESVTWTINGLSSSTTQALYMAQGAGNPMSINMAVQSVGGYSGTVSFSTFVLSGAGTGVAFVYPSAITIGSGQTVTATVTATATSYGTGAALYRASLAASGLSSITSGTLSIHVTGVGLATSPSSVSFAAGGSASVTVSVTSLPRNTQGFAGTVALSKTVVGGALSVACPGSLFLIANGTASGTCTFSGSTAGPFTVTITATAGTNGAIVNSTSVSVTVTSGSPPGIKVGASPPAVSGLVNSVETSQVTVSAVGSFSGTVLLSETSSPGGLSCTFSAGGVTVPPTGTRTLGCTSPTGGTFVVTVVGASGAFSASANVTFVFQDFSVSSSTTTVNVFQGGSSSAIITIASVAGFTGNVTLSATSMNVTSTIFPTLVLVPPFGSSTSALTVSAASTLAPGTYSVTVTGMSQGLTHFVTIPVMVLGNTAPGFGTPLLKWTHHLSLASHGGQQTFTATVVNPATNSWYVEVAITGSSDTGVPFTAQSAIVLVAPGAQATLTFSVPVPTSDINSKVSFTATIIYGSSATNLQFTSPATKTGSFAVVA